MSIATRPRARVRQQGPAGSVGDDPGVDVVGLLGALALSATSDGEPSTALADALALVGRFTGWPVGHVYLAGQSGTLEPTDIWWRADGGALDAFQDASEQVGMDQGIGLPGRVALTGEPAWIGDVEQDPNFPRAEAALAAGLRSAFALPVPGDGGVVAVLELFAREVVAPSPEFLHAVAVVGAVAGRVFERDDARRRLEASELSARQILDSAGDAFVSTDAAGVVTGWNEQAEALFGWSRDEAVGCPVSELIIPEAYRADHDEGVRRFLETGEPKVMGQRLELEALRRSGEAFPIEMTFWSMRVGSEWTFYSFGRDITARKAREAGLAHRALHDELTGLANRGLVVEQIEGALLRRQRSGRDLAVLFCDLDRFKVVNDSLGHAAGDRLLRAVADRVRAAVRSADTVGRVAGDEFVIVCEDLAGPAEAVQVAHGVLRALSEPVALGEDRLRAPASIGVALAGPDCDTAEDLLRDADAAMYRAKAGGRGRTEVFDDRVRERLRARLHTEIDLAKCLEQRQLRLHYQPIVALADERIVGVEALVRWQHPERGLLLPGEFIALAEETGLITPIGNWVLEEACRQARAWQDEGWRGLSVAVNLSARQITQAGFVDRVARVIDDARLDPARVALDLEVTESLLMSDPDATAATLGQLRALGVGLSIDDFGTGYSSLAYLKHFPVDVVKIDRSFITGIDGDQHDRSLVGAIADLGHALGLTVLAEGVETDAQRHWLTRLGYDLAQGYFFARPAPLAEVDLTMATSAGRLEPA